MIFDHRLVFLLSGRPLRGLDVAAGILLVAGFALSVFSGPHGASQLGMLHMPTAWLAFLLMIVVAFWAVVGVATGRSMPILIAQSVVPTGGMFTFLALWSGAVWLRAATGGWWSADPRQLAEVVMLLVYIAILAIPSVLPRARDADRAIGVVALVGLAVVVTLFFLVDGWSRVSGATVNELRIDAQLLFPMVLVAAGLWCYATYVCLVRLRCLIKEREYGLSDFFAVR